MPGGIGGENTSGRASLFGEQISANVHTNPAIGQSTPQPIVHSAERGGFFRNLGKTIQAFASIGNVLIFAYIFLGEVFLPDHLRATTFLGKRLGGIQGETALYAASQQAEAVTIVDGAKANVEIEKTCTINLREAARTVYTQCMAKPEGSHPICNLERQFYIDANSCDLGADPANQ